MQKKTKSRLISISLILFFASLGVYIILHNLRDNIIFFYPPSELHKVKYHNQTVRIGGLVKKGSIQKLSDTKIQFTLTDEIKSIEVVYDGILPALFREGQGIIAEGKLTSVNKLAAKNLLAKHDENYKPPKKVNVSVSYD